MIILISFKPFLDNKMSIFEEYGAFNKFSVRLIQDCLDCSGHHSNCL